MQFNDTEHYKKRTQLNIGKVNETVIAVTHWRNEKQRSIVSIITVDTGACGLHFNVSVDEARRIAAHLLAHADEVEEQHIALIYANEQKFAA